MPKEIRRILEDLYAIEPALKSREKDVIVAIEKLLATRPDTKFDKKFAQTLRRELISRFDGATEKSKASFLNIFTTRKFIYAVAGSFAAVSIIFTAVFGVLDSGSKKIALDFSPRIIKSSRGAFGSLALLTGSSNDGVYSATAPVVTSEGLADSAGMVAKGIGGGGGGVGMMAAPSQSVAMSAPSMIRAEAISYTYKYIGEDIDMSVQRAEVLKRQTNGSLGGDFGKYFTSLNLGFLNLSKFKNIEARDIYLYENRDYGYGISINTKEERVTINKNYERWVGMLCAGGVDCGEPNRMQPEDVPSDAELIAIADDFIKEYSINTKFYGAPEVDTSWKKYQDKTAQIYVPNEILVLYPIEIGGKRVYNESGYKIGMQISIDLRDKKVVNVYNLTTQNYISSEYDVITDWEAVKRTAEKGGMQPIYIYGEQYKTYELQLGQPSEIYMAYYKYTDKGQEEYLVPALLFDILNPPEGVYFYQSSVVVPLIKDFARNDNNDSGPIRIMPMPAIEPVAAPEITTQDEAR